MILLRKSSALWMLALCPCRISGALKKTARLISECEARPYSCLVAHGLESLRERQHRIIGAVCAHKLAANRQTPLRETKRQTDGGVAANINPTRINSVTARSGGATIDLGRMRFFRGPRKSRRARREYKIVTFEELIHLVSKRGNLRDCAHIVRCRDRPPFASPVDDDGSANRLEGNALVLKQMRNR